MQFTREINRLLVGLLVCFGLVSVAAAYWAIAGTDTLLQREDNPRLVEAEASIVRGAIFDRSDTPLVTSTRGGSGGVLREYLYPEMYSALGYYSLRYGVSGVEEAYNNLLRGADVELDLGAEIMANMLHRPTQGADVRLTLDLNIQTAVVEAMREHTGAVIVLDVPSGDVLALVSLPTYNPNTLDADWEQLKADPTNPFFNRVIQGNYQPGSTLQTPLLAAALLTGAPADEEIEDATAPVAVNGLELTCAVRLPSIALSLRDGYAFACPQPFDRLVEQIGPSAVLAVFDTFRLGLTQSIYRPIVADEQAATQASTLALSDDEIRKNALGQGSLTVSPLSMAMMAAAIVNDGNAPQPRLLLNTRPPDSDEWIGIQEIRPTVPMMTVSTARQLQDFMRNAVANGAAQNAGRPNIDIAGHAALAYSGEGTQVWFVGFATLPRRQGVAVAVVLENSNDPGLAADIGGTALMAAQEALMTENGSDALTTLP